METGLLNYSVHIVGSDYNKLNGLSRAQTYAAIWIGIAAVIILFVLWFWGIGPYYHLTEGVTFLLFTASVLFVVSGFALYIDDYIKNHK